MIQNKLLLLLKNKQIVKQNKERKNLHFNEIFNSCFFTFLVKSCANSNFSFTS